MGKRGPSPAGKLTVLPTAQVARPNPPHGLTARARNLWRNIVSSLPPDHFRAGDLPLLREYCEAADRAKQAEELIRSLGILVACETQKVKGEDGQVQIVVTKWKANPAIAIKTAAAGTMISLAVRLRICNSSKSGGRSKDEPAKPASKRDGLMFGGKA